MINLFPSLRLWWFLVCFSNIAAPPSLMNLLSFFLLSRSVLKLCFSIFISSFSASYSLFLYSFIQHGNIHFVEIVMEFEISFYRVCFHCVVSLDTVKVGLYAILCPKLVLYIYTKTASVH